MHRAAFRPAVRALRQTANRRFASTSPVDRPRSWKSSALRWGLAGGAIYYYSTSSVFAEEPAHLTTAAPSHFSEDDLPTVDSVLEAKRAQIQEKLESKNVIREPTSNSLQTPAAEQSSPNAAQNTGVADGPAALEEEAGQQGAFNPETGEINWDCPCLGGMADGPCGEEFKTAFSCFVYSDAEPKGMDCVDKFQGMQDCFRQHPDIYGAELADDEEAERAEAEAAAVAKTASSDAGAASNSAEAAPQTPKETKPAAKAKSSKPTEVPSKSAAPVASTPQKAVETEAHTDAIPTSVHDATAANEESKKEVEKEAPGEKAKKE